MEKRIQTGTQFFAPVGSITVINNNQQVRPRKGRKISSTTGIRTKTQL